MVGSTVSSFSRRSEGGQDRLLTSVYRVFAVETREKRAFEDPDIF